MNLIVIGLVLLSAALHAFRDFFSKQSADKQVFMWQFSGASIILTLPLALWILWQSGMPHPIGIAIGTAISCVHFLYWYSLAKAIEHGDLSHVYPIGRSAPAFVLLFSILVLQETTTPWGVLGILLVVLGAYTINLKRLTLRGLFDPFRALRHDHALRYALLTLAAVTIYTIVDDRGVEYAHPIVYFFLINTLSWIFFTAYILRIRTLKQGMTWKGYEKSILINALFGSGGYILMLIAYSLERASYVSGLRQVSVVIAVLLGGHFLQESHRAIRLMSACAIFLGAACIAIGG